MPYQWQWLFSLLQGQKKERREKTWSEVGIVLKIIKKVDEPYLDIWFIAANMRIMISLSAGRRRRRQTKTSDQQFRVL
ncbi:hypothetical protein CVT26_002302 [Gymnopilus dilepis]|uniref:Uncharacterized protein n=1 Tax=Gymnopilus dilepis TaxID=231916 RepID=A0A409WEC4_9AGAR|nr:hypothetical protein CVT26_002302 [Gymnopilus dilepis]